MAEKKPNHHQKNKQNRKPSAKCVNKPTSAKDVRINLRRAKFKSKPSKRHSDSEELDSEQYQLAPQPNSRWLPYDDISDVEDEGKDFESLLNIPVSAHGHFSFKSEKDWSFDISQSSELFSLDLRLLNAAISCIPFNECIGLDDKYFSKDQLTYIQSAAETARKDYENISKELSISKTKTPNENTKHESVDPSNTKIMTNFEKGDKQQSESREDEVSSEIENLEDDLDFLLSLKEPLMSRPTTILQITSTANIEEPKSKAASVPTKSIDLEKWLDSVLD